MRLPLAILVILSLCAAASAADRSATPCGPDSMTGPLRKLIPQGSGDADWRPYCREHDACYEIPGVDKAACDQRFFDQMRSSCARSGRPVRCRMSARMMYFAVRRFGTGSFDKAQRIAYAGGW